MIRGTCSVLTVLLLHASRFKLERPIIDNIALDIADIISTIHDIFNKYPSVFVEWRRMHWMDDGKEQFPCNKALFDLLCIQAPLSVEARQKVESKLVPIKETTIKF
jgi:hypothetical protein